MPSPTLPARLALGVALALAPASCNRGPLTVEIDRNELQARVAAQFPRELTHVLGRLTLENPNVVLNEGSDRLGLELDAKLTPLLFAPIAAKTAVSGRPHYDATTKAFFLQDPKVDRLEVPGIAAEQSDRLRSAVEAVALPALASLPVYELKQRDMKEATAEHVLKAVSVKNGKLVAELGLVR